MAGSVRELFQGDPTIPTFPGQTGKNHEPKVSGSIIKPGLCRIRNMTANHRTATLNPVRM